MGVAIACENATSSSSVGATAESPGQCVRHRPSALNLEPLLDGLPLDAKQLSKFAVRETAEADDLLQIKPIAKSSIHGPRPEYVAGISEGADDGLWTSSSRYCAKPSVMTSFSVSRAPSSNDSFN